MPDLAETLDCEFSTLNLRFEGGHLGSNEIDRQELGAWCFLFVYG